MNPLPYSTFSASPSTTLVLRLFTFCTTVVTVTPRCAASASSAFTKFLAPGSTGCAVTSTTITCPVATPRRSRQWRTRPVPLSSS